jgi:hypothetical protein
MSDTDPTPETPESTHPVEGDTSEDPTMAHTPPASTLAAAGDAVGEPPFDETADEDDEWLSTGPARGIRLAVPAAGLLAVVFVAAGFWGGVTLEKSHAGSSGGAAAGFGSRVRGAGAGFSFGGGGASASSSGTAGTISVVNGNTLYILSSTGALVKVTLSKSTTITRNADTTPAGLRPGDTVTVQGTTSSNGNVAATSISTTAPGVSSSTGGGFGGGGAGASGTSTTGGTTTSSGG